MLLTSVISAQAIWEDITPSYLKWGNNSNLKFYSNTLKKLDVWNYNPVSSSKKENVVEYERLKMNTYLASLKPTRIEFSIQNLNNKLDTYTYFLYDEKGRKKKHNSWDGVYWGFSLYFSGGVVYSRSFHDYKHYNGYYTTTGHSEYSSSRGSWKEISYIGIQFIRIEFDKDGIKVYEDDELLYSTTQKDLYSIEIMASSAARVEVQNFRVERITLYGKVRPYIQAGDNAYNNKDYINAVKNYTKAIDQGYKNYDIYYKRAQAYLYDEFCISAIEDYTEALRYKKTEEAYLGRGMAKLYKEDISALEDLKLGGTKGVAIAKEIEFELSKIADEAESERTASGTGFFIDSKGYIATNYHVIENSSLLKVYVTANGVANEYGAKVVAVDKNNDLAIIKIEDSKYNSLPQVPYTINGKLAEVGSSVYTMGYPIIQALGEEIKVTDGIVNSKTGYQGDITCYQISAPIQHGNSGGPLFDNTGSIVGVTNAGVQELQNVGYAIKVSYLNNLIENSPEQINLPTVNQLNSLSLTDKIKRISPYIVLIKTISK